MDYSAQGGWTDKEEQSNDYVAKNCNNLVFYSVFYRQPVQIHKKGDDMFTLGSLADKISSTDHHTLNYVYKFFWTSSQQGITVI